MILLAKRLLAGAWGYIAAGLAVLVTVLVARL
jgi:hypothetical protein